MWELVGYDGGTQDRNVKFPTGDSRIKFEASCKRTKTPSQWVKDAICATETFPGGRNANVYELHLLDNADKHTVITPTLRASSHPPFSVLNAKGELVVRMENNLFVGGGAELVPLAVLPVGCTIQFDKDAECPLSIFFSQPGGKVASPAIATLKLYSRAVIETVEMIEAAVPC